MREQTETGKRIARTAMTAALTLSVFVPGIIFAQTTSGGFEKPADIQKKVETVFAEAPVMIAVAKCESGNRQFYDSGNVFRGGQTGKYIGVFQIDENLHKNPAAALGYDIYTVDGNLNYAKYLYGKLGAQPWTNCSSAYYAKNGITVAPVTEKVQDTSVTTSATAVETKSTTATVSFAITKDLKLGVTDPQVQDLQKILNANGYPIATTGAGSAQNETTYFGEKTKIAVQKFQSDHKLQADGTVGPATRAALAQLVQ